MSFLSLGMLFSSQDPDFEAKEAEIAGLYLDPPKNALVICIRAGDLIVDDGVLQPQLLAR